MAAPRKPRKATGKKSVAKAGGSKKATPRKAAPKHKYATKPLSKREVREIVKGESPRAANERRLAQDRAYYESQDKKMLFRSVKSEKFPKGIPIRDFAYRTNEKGEITRYEYIHDRSQTLSPREFNEIADNPLAIPHYIPVHGTFKTGKKGIVGYRNAQTNEIVSPHYRFQVFGKAFNTIPDYGETPEDVERSRLYYASLEYWKRKNKERSEDLVTSYRIKKLAIDKIEMTEQQVLADPEFQALCEELSAYANEQHQFTKEYVASIDFDIALVNERYGTNLLAPSVKDLQNAVGQSEDYQRVLIELGRRLPSEDRPVGSYGPGYIKLVVVPYMEMHMGATLFEGEE